MVASSTSNHDAANGAENVSRRISFAKINEPLKVPNLLAIQTDSFDRLVGNERWAERLDMNVPDGRSFAALAHEGGFLTVDISIHPRHGWLRLLATR